MNKFKKKPVIIEAEKYESHKTLSSEFTKGAEDIFFYNEDGELLIKTLEGVMTAKDGDWIIKGVKGEFYPCKPDIFSATYEIVK